MCQGSLVPELPAIFNWALSADLEQSEQVLICNTLDNDTMAGFNNVHLWAKENLVPGLGSYVGYRSGNSPKETLDQIHRRSLLFPHALGAKNVL